MKTSDEKSKTYPVLALEQERCAALVAGDFDKTAALLSPRLVYVHSVGLIHDHSEFLRFIRDGICFDSVERQALRG